MTTLFKVLLLFSSLNILSHEFNPAHLSINESLTETNSYEAKWLYPVKNIGERAEIIFPYNCDVESKSPYVQGKYIVEDFNLTCSENIKGKSIEIINLSVLSDALISINFKDNEKHCGSNLVLHNDCNCNCNFNDYCISTRKFERLKNFLYFLFFDYYILHVVLQLKFINCKL